MSNDYTPRKEDEAFALPRLPEPDYEDARPGIGTYGVRTLGSYGHACAESARAPLIARIAELEKELSANDIDRHAELTHRLLRRAKIITEQGTRIAELEAEIAQVSGYCETLTQRCVDDTAENGRLRAEVEALRASLDWLVSEIRMTDLFHMLGNAPLQGDALLAAIDAARKGEGSEG